LEDNIYLEINFDFLKHNLDKLKNEMENQAIMAVLKGNAYGHGMIAVAKYIEDYVDYFGVGLQDEAVKLRSGCPEKPILIMSPYFDPDTVLDFNLTPCIENITDLKKLSERAAQKGKTAKFHLKINTGMNRFGISINEIPEFIGILSNLGNISLEGIFSHFAITYDRNPNFFMNQLNSFKKAISLFQDSGVDAPLIHMASSVPAIDVPESRFNMVRLGNALFGLCSPKKDLGLKTIAKLKGKVIDIKHLKKGEYIGYGASYRTKKDMRLGIIPIGFTNGFQVMREIGDYTLKEALISMLKVLYRYKIPRDMVYFGQKPLKIIGKGSMQFTVVDITDENSVNIGSELIFRAPTHFIPLNVNRRYIQKEKVFDPGVETLSR